MFVFSPKINTDKEIFTANYSSLLSQKDVILSATWTSTLLSGVDPNPMAMIVGQPMINGMFVGQMIDNGVQNATYLIQCTVTTSLGEEVTIYGKLLVTAPPDLP